MPVTMKPKVRRGRKASSSEHHSRTTTRHHCGPTPPASWRGNERLSIIEDGAVAIHDGKIDWVGPTDQLPNKNDPAFDASGKIVLPGFVDSHTHAVFAGLVRTSSNGGSRRFVHGNSRPRRWNSIERKALRKGQEISRFVLPNASLNTVRRNRSQEWLRIGFENEIRMLEAMKAESTLEVVPTYLGAHALPEEFRDNRDEFIERS